MSAPSNTDILLRLVQSRRTYYTLNKESPIPLARIEHIVKEALLHVPSSFNSQSTRVVVLFGAEHDKLWDIVTGVLKAKVPETKWERTGKKMEMFKQSAGTVSLDNARIWLFTSMICQEANNQGILDNVL